jgi:hypothetical protein
LTLLHMIPRMARLSREMLYINFSVRYIYEINAYV